MNQPILSTYRFENYPNEFAKSSFTSRLNILHLNKHSLLGLGQQSHRTITLSHRTIGQQSHRPIVLDR